MLIVTTGVAAAVNLLLNVVLIPLYGMYGTAVATSIGYGSMFAFHVWSARWIGFDPLAALQPRAIAVTVLVSAPLVFGFALLFQSPVYALVMVPPFGFAIFVTVAVATGAVRTEELQMALDYLPLGLRRVDWPAE